MTKAETTEEKRNCMKRKHLEGQCRNFTGIMNGTCKAGVVYKDVTGSSPPRLIPCLVHLRGGTRCDSFEPYTQEEIDAGEVEFKEQMRCLAEDISFCCKAPLDKSQVILSGRFKNHGPRFCSECGGLSYMV